MITFRKNFYISKKKLELVYGKTSFGFVFGLFKSYESPKPLISKSFSYDEMKKNFNIDSTESNESKLTANEKQIIIIDLLSEFEATSTLNVVINK